MKLIATLLDKSGRPLSFVHPVRFKAKHGHAQNIKINFLIGFPIDRKIVDRMDFKQMKYSRLGKKKKHDAALERLHDYHEIFHVDDCYSVLIESKKHGKKLIKRWDDPLTGFLIGDDFSVKFTGVIDSFLAGIGDDTEKTIITNCTTCAHDNINNCALISCREPSAKGRAAGHWKLMVGLFDDDGLGKDALPVTDAMTGCPCWSKQL